MTDELEEIQKSSIPDLHDAHSSQTDQIFTRQKQRSDTRPVVIINIQAWSTPIIGLIMLLVGFFIGYLSRPLVSAGTAQVTQNPTRSDVLSPVVEGNPELMEFLESHTVHFKGDSGAMITIIEFSDFQCPYCGKFANSVEQLIDETYIETGKVRFGYLHFAFLGDESLWAAEASECASDQDAFWAYHDLLFERQTGENQGAFNKENLKQFAADLGLDTQAFNACLDGEKYRDLVQSQSSMAESIGVTSTPSFAINGQTLSGAQPFEVFQQIIDLQLADQ